MFEYRKAINRIGSKANAVSTFYYTGQKSKDFFLNDPDYDNENKWLVNSLVKKNSHKRKCNSNSDDENLDKKPYKKSSINFEINSDKNEKNFKTNNSLEKYLPQSIGISENKIEKTKYQEEIIELVQNKLNSNFLNYLEITFKIKKFSDNRNSVKK